MAVNVVQKPMALGGNTEAAVGDKEATALPWIGQRVETRKRRLGDGGQCCLKTSVRSHLVSNNLGVRAVGG